MTYINTYSNEFIKFTCFLSKYIGYVLKPLGLIRIIGRQVLEMGQKNSTEVFGPNVNHSVIQTGLVEYKYVCDSLYWVGDKLLLPSSNWGPPT